MISIFYALLTIAPVSALSSQFHSVISRLDTSVYIQMEGQEKVLKQTEAKKLLKQWLVNLEQPEIIRSHPAKFNGPKETYGLYHLKSVKGDYRFFYYSEVKDNIHKIVRIKIIKV